MIVAIIVTGFTHPVARARATSVFVFVAIGGGSTGLLLGGFLTQLVNWHWIFFINLPIGAAALAPGALLIRENQGLGLRQGVDVAGSILVTIALMIRVYASVGAGDSGWSSARALGFGLLALLLLAGFAGLESRLENPIMALRILRLGGLAGSSAVRGLIAAGMFAAFFLGALYLEHVPGFDPRARASPSFP